ncbi:hypothetical protein AB4142_35140, partial [Variovorax sp. 2RAF20]
GKSVWHLQRDGRQIAVAVGGNISANEASLLLEAVRAGAGIAMLPMYQIAPLLFRELGAEVIGIGAEPNGVNINDGVGSTHIDN